MKTPHEYAWDIAHAVKRKKPPPMYIVDIIEDHVRKIIKEVKQDDQQQISSCIQTSTQT
jgi:hypothetical protein